MTRSTLVKSQHLDDEVMKGAARLRARVLALLNGALRNSGLEKAEVARRLGVRKSAVNAVFRGNGNVRINTLSEYLGVMGFEADVVAVHLGEVDLARDEGRAPSFVALTLSDDDRRRVVHVPSDFELVAVHSDPARKVIFGAWQKKEASSRHGVIHPDVANGRNPHTNPARDAGALYRQMIGSKS